MAILPRFVVAGVSLAPPEVRELISRLRGLDGTALERDEAERLAMRLESHLGQLGVAGPVELDAQEATLVVRVTDQPKNPEPGLRDLAASLRGQRR